MKSFAHRGWSAGKGENTIEAFRKSVEAGIDGVEFDVRYGVDSKSIVVVHNQAKDEMVLTLREALHYLKNTNLELLVELKEYSDQFYVEIVDMLVEFDLHGRATLFAFPHISAKFPWSKERKVRLGTIALLPYQIRKYIRTYNPDMILIGWGDRVQRAFFKALWSILSLSSTVSRHSNVRFVVGVAYSKRDVVWLKKHGLYCYTIDDQSVLFP